MIQLYRLALRLLLPGVAGRHGDDAAGTAARLSEAARAAGRGAWLRYWVIEFHSLVRTAWSERATRKASSMLPNLLRDIRYSVRLLTRTPSVTFVALLTLALGIGANTAIFSIINGVLLRPLAYADPDRLYLIQHRDMTDPTQLGSTTPGNFEDIRRASKGFQPMAAFSGVAETMVGRGEPERLLGVRSIGSVLEVLGVQPQIGRVYTANDERPEATRTIVISNRLWRRVFDGRAEALGQTLVLAGEPNVIVGVMPAGFAFPDTNADFWGPSHLSPAMRASRSEFYLLVLGRLAPGATAGDARGELDAVMSRLRSEHPQANSNVALDARPLAESLVTNVSEMLWILMASVGCVLLIACANLANLVLAKASGRSREIAIRQAIGAGRGRLVRQLLVESVVLAILGGAAGLVTGKFLLDALVAWLPAGIPRIAEVTVDARVMLFTFFIAALTGVFFGLAPALQLAGRSPVSVLRTNTRTASGRAPLRALLVVAELAVALVLLAGAGLLLRSFVLMQRVDPGFATDKLLTFQVRMEGPGYARAPQRIDFVDRVVTRLEALPGVTGAAASSYAPIVGRGTGAWFNLLARPVPPGTTPPAVPYRVITTGYFKTMGIPLMRGRLLRESDGVSGTPSVVISESLARRFWSSPEGLSRRSGEAAKAEDPIGSEIYLGPPDYRLFDRATVVGIVKDVKLAGLGNSLTDSVYGLQTLMPFWWNFTFTVKTAGDPMALAASVRQIVRDTDRALAVARVQSMADIMRTSVAPTRASMLLLVLFAGVAVVMAAIGVFGVMSYAVNLRSREMGIRLALGARPAEVRRMVVVEGMKQAVIGVVIGLTAAATLTRFMTAQLFGVKPGDPLTLGIVALLLLATAALASYVPARRATRVDPSVVLRTE